jgi:hypothetical protein
MTPEAVPLLYRATRRKGAESHDGAVAQRQYGKRDQSSVPLVLFEGLKPVADLSAPIPARLRHEMADTGALKSKRKLGDLRWGGNGCRFEPPAMEFSLGQP